ncbi:MAG: diaminopimelate decarboxylase [Deltaproteobacteria bacterium]|nr:diaminopimelate decarboxylase [Deltaproteobacteria bacterium]
MTLPSKAFAYEAGTLTASGVDLRTVADAHGTPTWVYAAERVDAAYRSIEAAMKRAERGGTETLIAYAIKANGNLALLKRLASLGCGADIVSGGELLRALKAGVPASKIVYSGVGKSRPELKLALESEIRAVHVESESELKLLGEVAADLGRKATIALRVNPNVDAETHPYIATGLHSTKFGLEIDVARELVPAIVKDERFHLDGVSCHIGSQLGTVEPLREAVTLLARFALECRELGAPIRSLDVGGGWPLTYGNEKAPYPSDAAFGDAIGEGLDEAGANDFDLITEPGRSLVGDAGALLTRVLTVKDQGGKRFVILDGAMTELIRPALYQAYHAIVPVVATDAETHDTDLVGPVCESGDFFARGRAFPSVSEGDLVAILGAGAYGREMASTYNARPRAAEVLVEAGETRLVRERGDAESLWAGERL